MHASDVPVSLLQLSANSNAQQDLCDTLSCSHEDFVGCCLDDVGIVADHDKQTMLALCLPCHSSLAQRKIPALALANNLVLGEIPDELKELTAIKEVMIAWCRSKCWIIQLKESNQQTSTPNAQ